MTGTTPDPASLFDRVGGSPTFRRLVHGFYEGVAADPVLRPMYPEEDLGPAEDRLRMFLEQYWGGPRDYSDQRGHPRLRLRHAPFPVSAEARDHWLAHMRASLDALDLDPADADELWSYLVMAAQMMVNVDDDPG